MTNTIISQHSIELNIVASTNICHVFRLVLWKTEFSFCCRQIAFYFIRRVHPTKNSSQRPRSVRSRGSFPKEENTQISTQLTQPTGMRARVLDGKKIFCPLSEDPGQIIKITFTKFLWAMHQIP